MNLNLKAIIQNLDAHIHLVTTARDVLVRAMSDEPGVPEVPRGKPAKAGAPNGKGKGARKDSLRPEPSSVLRTPSPVPTGEGQSRATTLAGRAVSTVAGAMKLAIAGIAAGEKFGSGWLEQKLNTKYGEEEFWKVRSGNGFSSNLAYWVKTGKLKLEDGGYMVVDREFFGKVEY